MLTAGRGGGIKFLAFMFNLSLLLGLEPSEEFLLVVGGGGGWVVYRYIIMPLRGPTCKLGLARNQVKLNSKLGPSMTIVILKHRATKG